MKKPASDVRGSRAAKGFAAEDLFAAWCRMHGCRVHQAGRERKPVRIERGKLVYPPADIFDAFDLIVLDLWKLPDTFQALLWTPDDSITTRLSLWAQVTTSDGRFERKARVDEAGPWPEWWLPAVLYEAASGWMMTQQTSKGTWVDPFCITALYRPAVESWAKKQDANKGAKKFIEKMAGMKKDELRSANRAIIEKERRA